MQIVHRLSFASSLEIQIELAAVGVEVAAEGPATFEVVESNALWKNLELWIEVRKPLDIITTKFTTDEVRGPDWLELVPHWHNGYPQPDPDVFGYLNVTFDQATSCDDCGIGLTQVAPFRMLGEPKWGRRSILQLNWVFDDFFVTPDVWSQVFKPFGIDRWPVLTANGKSQLATVVQLKVDGLVGIRTDELVASQCGKCQRVKYLPHVRGPFPELLEKPESGITKTREYFGSGAAAHRRVLVSQGLRRALADALVRGSSFRPVRQEVGD